jgi:hypothetical protein
MIWWRFEAADGRTGYIAIDETRTPVGLYWDDGTPVAEGVSYTVTDEDATAPGWAA